MWFLRWLQIFFLQGAYVSPVRYWIHQRECAKLQDKINKREE